MLSVPENIAQGGGIIGQDINLDEKIKTGGAI